jgi:hypothetical protein
MTDLHVPIRNLRGNWPTWTADLDDGRKVIIYIQDGEVHIGVGATGIHAAAALKQVPNEWNFNGVSDCVDALIALRRHGYYFVCEPYGR